MLPFNILSETPIASSCLPKYRGMAFDGCYFYLTLSNCCQIAKLNCSFEQVESVETFRKYSCICYDTHDCCFWAASECHSVLYKLDKCLNEIDNMPVKAFEGCGGAITGVSFDCSDNALVVAFTNGIIKVPKDGCHSVELIQKSRHEWLTGVLSIAPAMITIGTYDNRQRICLFPCADAPAREFCLPPGYFAESIVFDPCEKDDCKKMYNFVILATKRGQYSYLLKIVMCAHTLGSALCYCNYMPCRCCCDDDCHVCSKNACTDIIESVALMETALSHILNAEGEKLQKIIASTDDVCTILAANKSINQTVVNISHMEHILYDKLSIITEFCEPCHDCCNDGHTC